MVAQNRAEGNRAYAGSSFENNYNSQNTPTVPTPQTTPNQTTPRYLDNGYIDTTGMSQDQARSFVQSQLESLKKQLAQRQVVDPNMQEQTYEEKIQPYTNPYEKQYEKLLNPSKDETNYQKQMDALEAQLRSFDNSVDSQNQTVSEQPVAQGFISGQQAAISNRAAIDRQALSNNQLTLQQKLATAQAQRMASLDAVRFNLERADKAQSRQDSLAQQKLDEAYRNRSLDATNTRLNTPKSTTTTQSERKAIKLGSYANGFVAGQRMPDGTPILSPSGNITYVAWKDAIKDAVANGISRADFIKQYGNMLFKGDLDGYGLTSAEKKLIQGTGTSNREI